MAFLEIIECIYEIIALEKIMGEKVNQTYISKNKAKKYKSYPTIKRKVWLLNSNQYRTSLQ